MLETMRSEWWLMVLRGLVAVAFGVLALVWPTGTATALIILVALFVLVDGIFSLIAAVRARRPSWGLGAFEGVLGVVIGVLALAMPRITAMVLAVLVGVWALVTGILELVAAIRFRHELRTEWLLGSAGVLSILLGIAMIIAPSAGVVVIAVLVGIYALLFGLALLVYGLRLRRLGQ
jgi:uncharacterized membrane protein HdeD (DUF308 family)